MANVNQENSSLINNIDDDVMEEGGHDISENLIREGGQEISDISEERMEEDDREKSNISEEMMIEDGQEMSVISQDIMTSGGRESPGVPKEVVVDEEGIDVAEGPAAMRDEGCRDISNISGDMLVEDDRKISSDSEDMIAEDDRKISDMSEDKQVDSGSESSRISEDIDANGDREITSEDPMYDGGREISSNAEDTKTEGDKDLLTISEDMATENDREISGISENSVEDEPGISSNLDDSLPEDDRKVLTSSNGQEDEMEDERDSGNDEDNEDLSDGESDDDSDEGDDVTTDVAIPGEVQESNEDEEDIFEGLLEDIGPELLHILVPDALFKLFSLDGSSGVEASGTEDQAISLSIAATDDHGLKEFAGIFHLTLVSLEQWLYQCQKGRAILATIVQEFPGLRNYLEEGLRNLIQTLVQPLGQLKDGTHPHFQVIEQWFANHHLFLKTALNFFHGLVTTLMNSYVFRGVSRLDVPRIVTELAGAIHTKLNDYLDKMFTTQEGLRLLRANLQQIPAAFRPDERGLRNMMRMWMLPLGQLKNRANPMVRQIDHWVATSHVLVKLAIEVFHGGFLGLVSNRLCTVSVTQDIPQLLLQITNSIIGTLQSFSQWLFETPKGIAILRTCLLETFANFHPSEQSHRNLLYMWGHMIAINRNAPDPFARQQAESIERMLAKEKELLAMFVKSFHGTLIWSINTSANRELVHFYIDVLRVLHEINVKSGHPVSRRLFWIQGLERNLHLGMDLLQYVENASGDPGRRNFTWLDVPFLLNVRTKWKFLSMEAVRIMKRDMLKADKENTIRRKVNDTIFATWYPQAKVPFIPTCVRFHIDGTNIVQSAIQNVDKYWHQDSDQPNPVWLKPLEINFEGESALDFGGPSKEFFTQLFPALLETDIPIFRRLDDQIVSSDVWFNVDYLDYSTLEKIGLLFALLIFNGAIATIHFPELLYEKLLTNRDPVPTDLEAIDKAFVKQLYKLREMTSEDLEGLYLDFEGLQPGGQDVDVTKENLETYITETMRRRLAIPQLNAFARGFNRLAAMTPILREIFLAEDLRDVIVGEELDWTAFRQSARYMFPYSPNHRVIMMFWKVFEELEERDKRRFLKFLTGADHVPLGGFVPFPVRMLNHRAEKYRDPIERDKFPEPGDLMPEVMTCKGYLSMDLPDYQTEEDLRYRLMLALETDGFHREAPHHVSDTAPAITSPILQNVVRTSIQLAFGGMR